MTHPAFDFEGGRLSLRWRGKRAAPFFYCTPDPDAATVRRFRDAGVTGVSFTLTADFHPYGLAAPVWLAPGRYDYSQADARARAALAGFSEAMLLLRVHVASPPWWDAAHPEELVVWNGDVRSADLSGGYLKRTAPSWSSRLWRAAAADGLRRLLEHALRSDWGRSVGGVLVASGTTEEWFQVGVLDGLLPDDSRPAREGFRAWLHQRGLDQEAVRRRHGVDRGSEGAIPPVDRRRRPGSAFRDPVADAWAMDFDAFLAEETASFIGELCGVVHDVSERRWFAGAFYGYLVEMPFHGEAVLHGGHLALDAVLRDPRIDFLASPASYARRGLRLGATQSMLPIASIHAMGKAVFHENDVRTHGLFDDAGYGFGERPSETQAAQIREAAFAVTQGAGLWWFDMSGTFYEDDLTLQTIARTCAIAALPRPPRVPPPVAFVIDEESMAVTHEWPDRYADMIPRQLLELSRAGVPCDVRLLSELPERHGYRYLVFPNLFRVEPERQALLRRRLANCHGALFLGPVGLAPLRSGSPVGPGRVTGLPLASRVESVCAEVVLVSSGSATERSCAAFGRRFARGTRVVAEPAGVSVLGAWADTGEAAFVEAVVDGVRVAYAAEAPVPADGLRGLLRRSGVDVHLDAGDVVFSDGSVIGAIAATAGTKTFRGLDGAAVAWCDPPAVIPVVDGAIRVPMAAGRAVMFAVLRDVAVRSGA